MDRGVQRRSHHTCALLYFNEKDVIAIVRLRRKERGAGRGAEGTNPGVEEPEVVMYAEAICDMPISSRKDACDSGGRRQREREDLVSAIEKSSSSLLLSVCASEYKGKACEGSCCSDRLWSGRHLLVVTAA